MKAGCLRQPGAASLEHSLVNASCYLTVLKNITEETFFLSGVWYQPKIVLVHFDSFNYIVVTIPNSLDFFNNWKSQPSNPPFPY